MNRASAIRRVPRSLRVLACCVLLALHACAQRQDADPSAASVPSYEAREWLEQIGSAHAHADEALAHGQREQASSALRAALDRPVPPELAAEHVRVVQQDLWYRLSAVDVGAEPTKALLEAERGLALGRGGLFGSNLLVARGHALQALGRDTEAASSYQEALLIAERLLRTALGPGTDGGP